MSGNVQLLRTHFPCPSTYPLKKLSAYSASTALLGDVYGGKLKVFVFLSEKTAFCRCKAHKLVIIECTENYAPCSHRVFKAFDKELILLFTPFLGERIVDYDPFAVYFPPAFRDLLMPVKITSKPYIYHIFRKSDVLHMSLPHYSRIHIENKLPFAAGPFPH